MIKSGIYIIKNKVNEKFYIGSAVYINARWAVHKTTLNKNIHKNRKLQNAWNKYDENNFIFEILELVEDVNDLIIREQYWIDKLNACEVGYNLSPTAGSTLGVKYSDGSKEKLKKPKSEEHKNNISKSLILNKSKAGKNNGMYDKNHTRESKEKNKYLKDGTLKSEAYKGENNHFYGKFHTKESKEKISEGRIKRLNDDKSNIKKKVNIKQVKEIKLKLKNTPDINLTLLGNMYNVSRRIILRIKNEQTWKHVKI